MKRKVLLLVVFIATSVTLIGCSSLANIINTNTTNDSIDVTYALETNNFDDYISDDGNSTVVNAAIGLASTVEVTVNIDYSYTQTSYSPFGGNSRTVTGTVTSQASAFFINQEGYLMTNAHVVTLSDYEDLEDFTYENVDVQINYADSNVYFDVEVIAYDSDLDLAVLKVDPTNIENLQYLSFYDLTDPDDSLYQTDDAIKLLYGETVIAVGNAEGYGLSITEGIISAPLRYFNDDDSITEAIQTDTAVNSGNSGGPLLNKYGYVIGIVSFKIVSDGTENLGYAIPSYVMMAYIDSLQLDISYNAIS